jgi:hypothetical protein
MLSVSYIMGEENIIDLPRNNFDMRGESIYTLSTKKRMITD